MTGVYVGNLIRVYDAVTGETIDHLNSDPDMMEDRVEWEYRVAGYSNATWEIVKDNTSHRSADDMDT